MEKIKFFFIIIGMIFSSCNITIDQEKKKMNELIKLAESGDAEAQNRLSIKYNNGSNNFPKNRDKFYYWVKKSANQGNPQAQYSLAAAMMNDNMDVQEIIKIFKICAFNGNGKWQSEALIALSNFVEDGTYTEYNSDSVYELITRAGLQKNPAACYALAVVLLKKRTDPEIFFMAKTLLEESASGRFPEAEYLLGLLYWKSKYLNLDTLKAAELIKKSAEHGHPEAQFVYSKMLEDGIGTPKNTDEAKKYKEKSRKNNFSGKLLYEIFPLH